MPRRKSPFRKNPIVTDIIKAINLMNGFRIRTTTENIKEHLCNKIPRAPLNAQAVANDPTLVGRLLDVSVSEGRIVRLALPEENGQYTYKTPKYFGDRDRKYVVPYCDEIPTSAYYTLLKFAEQLESIQEADGITAQEFLEGLHGSQKFLSYNNKSVTERLIPDALKKGHLVVCSGTGEATRYKPTVKFRDAYRDFVKSQQNSQSQEQQVHQVQVGDSNMNSDHIKTDPDADKGHLIKNIKIEEPDDELMYDCSDTTESSDVSLPLTTIAKEEPMDVDHHQVENFKISESESPNKSATSVLLADSSSELNESFESKEKIESISSPENQQPQRVSQRKKIKKSLGPDFVESSEMNIYMQSKSSAGTSIPVSSSLMAVGTCSFCTGLIRSHNKSNSVVCSSCEFRVHTSCIKTLVNLTANTQWQCSNCLGDNICVVCSQEVRKPDLYVVCKTCKQPYHAQCWRTKANSACGFCTQTTNISEPTPTKVDNNIPITGKNVVIKSPSSLLQSGPSTGQKLIVKVGQSIETKSKTPLSNSPKLSEESLVVPQTAKPAVVFLEQPTKSRGRPTLAKTVKFVKDLAKTIIQRPFVEPWCAETVQPPKTAESAETVESSAVEPPTADVPPSAEAVEPPTIVAPPVTVAEPPPANETSTTSEHPAISEPPVAGEPLTNGVAPADLPASQTETATIIKSVKLAQSKKEKRTENPIIIRPMIFPRNKPEKSLIKVVNPVQVPVSTQQFLSQPRKRKSEAMDYWLKKPGKEICYNFQTWFETELKPNCEKYNPDLDVSPLATLPSMVTEWTSDNVHRFVSTLGFKTEADTFKDKDIDGLTLLLLSRYDFIHSLSIKIGPALKIFAVVNRMHQEM